MNTTLASVLLSGLVFAGYATSAQPHATVAFTNVSVVPMDDKTILADHTVVVTNGRISAMGPAASTVVPDGAMRVDGQGKYVMPGLAEMHGHIPPATAPRDYMEDVLFLYVANGVTTVRGMQGAPGQLELREAAARGDMIAPTLYLAGPAFSGNTVRTSEEATARVRQQKAEGWDVLKVQRGLSRDSYNAMAMTARTLGIPFGGHVPSAVGVTYALVSTRFLTRTIDGAYVASQMVSPARSNSQEAC